MFTNLSIEDTVCGEIPISAFYSIVPQAAIEGKCSQYFSALLLWSQMQIAVLPSYVRNEPGSEFLKILIRHTDILEIVTCIAKGMYAFVKNVNSDSQNKVMHCGFLQQA